MTNNITNPFEKVRLRFFIWWLLIGFIILILVLVVAGDIKFISYPFVYLGLYIVLILWFIYQARKNKINFKKFFINPDHKLRAKDILLSIAISLLILVFFMGLLLLMIALLVKSLPHVVENFLNFNYIDSPVDLHEKIMQIISGIILAPFVEEIFFRGIMLERFALKWRISTAIIIMSILFAVVHVSNPIGAFVFGLAMALLYFKTKTLVSPIIGHFVSNLISIGLPLLNLTSVGFDPKEIIASAESGLIMSVIMVVITFPLIIMFFVKNWPQNDTIAPYNS